jgi:hypothetical protein
MTEPLRPMSTGQLLDQTFALYRKNFLLFVGIAAVGPAANVIFQLLTVGGNVGVPFSARRGATGAAALAPIGLGMLFGYVILLAGMAISNAATVKAVAEVHLGRETSIIAAYRALRGRIWSLFGTVALIVLIVGGAALALAIVMVLIVGTMTFAIRAAGRAAPDRVAAATLGIVVIVITVLLLASIVAIYARYAFAIQACVVENLGPGTSLKRSVFLSKGGRGRVVIIYLVFAVLAGILGFGLGAIAGGAGGMLHNRIAAAVLIYLAGFIAGSLTGPLATIGLSLLYYDERVRKEAFDLQLMMSSLDAPAMPGIAPAQI